MSEIWPVTNCAPSVHRACIRAVWRLALAAAMISSVVGGAVAQQRLSATTLQSVMTGCLSAVNAQSITAFDDLTFERSAKGTFFSDIPAGDRFVRVIFGRIDQPATTMCVVFGYGATANDVILRWDDVEELSKDWHEGLLRQVGWEDVTEGVGVGVAALRCDADGRNLVVTAQPVWQMFAHLDEASAPRAPQDAAFKFEVVESERIDCKQIRAKAADSKGTH